MSRADQRGFSLAETVLALLIGSLVLTSALLMLQLHLQQMTRQREPYQAQQEVVWLMARWQQAMTLAGQGEVPALGWPMTSRRSVWPADATGAGTPRSDQLLLQRLLGEPASDCEGTVVAAGQVLVERYHVRADASSDQLVLACDAGSCIGDQCQRLGDAGVALSAGLRSLQILYAVASEPGSLRWLDASALQTQPEVRVLGVRIALTLAGPSRGPEPRWQMTWELPHG